MTNPRPFLPPTPNRVARNTRDRMTRLERYPTPTIIQMKAVADNQTVAVIDGRLTFAISEDLTGLSLIDADAFITTVSSSGLVTVQLRRRRVLVADVDMLSTSITILVGQFTSYALGTTPPVINAANSVVSTGDLVAIDVDTAGTGARGLGLILTFGVPTA